jgi:tripartite-type tricarboxylate transporter receptor subunit TctC
MTRPTTLAPARAALRAAACALAATTLLPLTAGAQPAWPNRPIELLYPYPPGNTTDSYVRLLAAGMSKRLGVPVQVINKPGGGGVVGTAELVRAKPDGYTIGTWTPGPGITQILAGNAPYKRTDYTPVAAVCINTFVLAARGDVPASNLREFGEWAKKQGKPITIASYAPASVPGLLAAKIARQDGWPYKVVSFPNPSAKELTSGDADLSTTGADMVASFAKAGQVKVLSAWMPNRTPLHPNAPTLKESGHGDVWLWTGLIAPAGTPRPIVERLAAAARDTLNDPEIQDFAKKNDLPQMYLGPAEAEARIAADEKWITELMTEFGMVKK